jgi:branched-chain amino acid transport system substrate-binding protein
MRFLLLGPFAVEDDHGPLRIAPGRESALLALLLVHRGEPLTNHRIVEELWGEAYPQNVAKSVQVYVSRLRKALGPNRIETTPAGYRIRLDRGELDVEQFDELVDAGRREEALALWRGEPLTDFRYASFAQGEARRLEEIHRDLVADVLDDRLADGDTPIAELETLIAREPLWERPRGQLMRALYLAGRQAEALEVYRETRALLDDELGIEPGPELQRLERAVLVHDPELGSPRQPARRLSKRKRWTALIVLGLLLVAAAAAAVLTVSLWPASAHSLPYEPNSAVRIDAASGRVDASVPIAGAPAAVAVTPGRVWVGSSTGLVSPWGAGSLRAEGGVSLGAVPEQLVASGKNLWAVAGRVVSGIDPSYDRVRPRIVLPASSAGGIRIAAAPRGGVWIVDGSPLLRRYDGTGHRISVTPTGLPLSDVASIGSEVWALSRDRAALLELSSTTHRILGKIPLELRPGVAAPLPFALAVGDGAIWVLAGSPPSLIRVDPRVGAVTNTVPLGIGSDPVAFTVNRDGVWAADSGDGTIARIDPSTLALRRIVVGGAPVGIVAGGGSRIWATVQAGLDANTGGVPSPLADTSGTALPAALCSPIYGEGKPNVLLAADLPLQGLGGDAETLQMSNAIRFVLAEHRFRAGRYSVGYELCDDSSAQTGSWTPATCRATAQAIAADASVLGVIGPFNSGCAEAELPILAHADGGPVAELSPSATYVGLTHHGPGTEPGEPGVYRANGAPIFLRDVAADDAQGAANAILARRLGVHRLFLLPDGSAYGRGLTAAAAKAAARVGVTVIGSKQWTRPDRFRQLAEVVAARHPDGVFLAGVLDEDGNGLVRELRRALPATTHILLSDGFTPFPSLLQTGPAAEGATVTISLPSLASLPPAGQQFVTRFAKAIGTTPEPYAVAAAEAAETMLDAVAASDGTRRSVRRALFTRPVTGGILGSFRFDRDGDTTKGNVSVYQIRNGRAQLLTTITPSVPCCE